MFKNTDIRDIKKKSMSVCATILDLVGSGMSTGASLLRGEKEVTIVDKPAKEEDTTKE